MGDSGNASPGGVTTPTRATDDGFGAAQRTRSNGNAVPAYPNGGGAGQGNYATIGGSSSVASSLSAAQYGGNNASLRTASPAPSAASDTSRLKDGGKKRLKNPFASLKKF